MITLSVKTPVNHLAVALVKVQTADLQLDTVNKKIKNFSSTNYFYEEIPPEAPTGKKRNALRYAANTMR
jgi:hypothetical protein